jgi:hypothetical protein
MAKRPGPVSVARLGYSTVQYTTKNKSPLFTQNEHLMCTISKKLNRCVQCTEESKEKATYSNRNVAEVN